MGNILGSTAQKFGIWVRKTTGEYDFTKKYGENPENAFLKIRDELCKLVDAGKANDYTSIRNNMIAPIVRFKILAMYHPDKYLAIHSARHLSYFCEKVGIPFTENDDELILQHKLILWKERKSEFNHYSLLEYVAFLYRNFGVPPKIDKEITRKKSKLRELKNSLYVFDNQHPKTKLTEIEIKQRSLMVANIVKERAAGVCQLCDKPAPFYNKKGEAYLECHHVIWLSRDGVDEIYNAVALCPNCHRKMHVLDDMNDVEKLKLIAKK
jgi:5-methylcytosine-specific restriction protein A